MQPVGYHEARQIQRVGEEQRRQDHPTIDVRRVRVVDLGEELRDGARAVERASKRIFGGRQSERIHACNALELRRTAAGCRIAAQRCITRTRLREQCVDPLAIGEAQRRDHERLDRRGEAIRDFERTMATR